MRCVTAAKFRAAGASKSRNRRDQKSRAIHIARSHPWASPGDFVFQAR
jgi:hypothetical protein